MSPMALPSQHAAVLYGPKDLRIENRTLWPPQYNQAQVSVVSTGLCGSDCEHRALNLSFHLGLTPLSCSALLSAGQEW
jgi:hypothetical protein